jgi:multiple sugar transport system substrate-binding protein
MRKGCEFLGAAILAVAGTTAHAQTISLWSHWADEKAKVAFVEEAAKRFEAKHPGAKVEITWYQKGPLNTALQSALRAGKGPDVFYADPFQVEYIENALIQPLNELLATDNIEDWAKAAWTYDGKLYALPLEAQTIELYYNTDLAKKFGVELAPGGALDTAAFLDLVKKAKEGGVTPIVVGVADRDYPGAYITGELLLKKLGPDDYSKLLAGELPYSDPRVVEVFTYVHDLAEAGAFPKSIASLKLGESHGYFYNNPGGVLFPMGSFYPSRAFNPPADGGQPDGFPLGMMNYPVPPDAACPTCKTNRVGGSYVVNAASEHPDLAAAFLNEMTAPDMAQLWVSTVLVQTGVKVDYSTMQTDHRAYFDDLAAANAGTEPFVGMLLDHLRGGCLDAYKQVVNVGLPAGLVTVDQAVEAMQAACSQKS